MSKIGKKIPCRSCLKKGDHSNPSNYCPIALTSSVAKVFETLLNSHSIKHLESNNLLSDHQYLGGMPSGPDALSVFKERST